MFAALLLAVAAQNAAPAPLQPTGKWTIDYAPNRCTLSRTYGDKTLAIDWVPLSSSYKLIEVDRGIAAAPRLQRRISTRIEPGETLAEQMLDEGYVSGKGRISSVFILSDPIAAIRTAATIRPVDEPGRQSYAILEGGQAAKVLRACRDDWASTVGVDPAVLARISVDAVPRAPETWIGPDDYPRDAIRYDKEGDTTLMWTIGDNGRAFGCRILQSSGYKPLDTAACNAIRERARYEPAMDAVGVPVPSVAAQLVRWRLPR